MLLAQLHHKVPRDFEGMEDVLTSSVFALLRYLPPEIACELLSEWAQISVQPSVSQVWFWPRYPTPQGFETVDNATEDDGGSTRGDTEPDVVIQTREWLVLIEIKYQSELDNAYDQLGREFVVGRTLADKKDLDFKLLVLTANVLEPKPARLDLRDGLRTALARAHDAGAPITQQMLASVPNTLRWLSWHRVYSALARIAERPDVAGHTHWLLQDTCQLLEIRGLKPYSSKPLDAAIEHWRNAGIPLDAWSEVLPYRYRTGMPFSAGWTALSSLPVEELDSLAWKLDRALP